MKKTILCILLVLTAAALLLSACTKGVDPVSPTKDPASSTANASSGDATAAPTEEPAPTDEPSPTDEPTPTEEPTPSPAPTADPSIEKGTNVALSAEIDDVSSTTGETHVQWGWSYEFINDGIRWDANPPASLGWTTNVGVNLDDPLQEEWIVFELENYTLIDTVNVCPTISAACFPIDFHIEVSLDGKNYVTVASVEGCDRVRTGSDEPVVMTFEPVTAKYVQFVATKLYEVPSGNDGILMQIGEIEIIAG